MRCIRKDRPKWLLRPLEAPPPFLELETLLPDAAATGGTSPADETAGGGRMSRSQAAAAASSFAAAASASPPPPPLQCRLPSPLPHTGLGPAYCLRRPSSGGSDACAFGRGSASSRVTASSGLAGGAHRVGGSGEEAVE